MTMVQGTNETKVCAGVYFSSNIDACEEREGRDRSKNILPDLLLCFICKCECFKWPSQGLEMCSCWVSRK